MYCQYQYVEFADVKYWICYYI